MLQNIWHFFKTESTSNVTILGKNEAILDQSVMDLAESQCDLKDDVQNNHDDNHSDQDFMEDCRDFNFSEIELPPLLPSPKPITSKKKKKRKLLVKSKTSGKVSLEAKKAFNEDLGIYICPHCNLQLKAGMTNHLKWHKEHPNEIYPSRSTCEICGKTFKKIGILRAHIMRMHSNLPKKFKCAFEGCDKAFKVSSSYIMQF